MLVISLKVPLSRLTTATKIEYTQAATFSDPYKYSEAGEESVPRLHCEKPKFK